MKRRTGAFVVANETDRDGVLVVFVFVEAWCQVWLSSLFCAQLALAQSKARRRGRLSRLLRRRSLAQLHVCLISEISYCGYHGSAPYSLLVGQFR